MRKRFQTLVLVSFVLTAIQLVSIYEEWGRAEKQTAPCCNPPQPGQTSRTFNTPQTAPIGPLKPKRLQVPDDWPEFFTPRVERQFRLEFPYVHQARRACRPPVDLLMMTLSLPGNREQRQAIRRTWGSVVRTLSWPGRRPEDPRRTLPKRLGLIFLLGEERQASPDLLEAVRLESEAHGDVVQWAGLHDTYFNLTMKVLLGLKWVSSFCSNVSHVIKTDDDTFVHVPRLLWLLENEPTTNAILGPYFTTSTADRGGRYEVSQKAYPFAIYAPHVKGNLYVLPGKAVSSLVKVAPYLPYNNMEDAHVTGTLARSLGLQHRPFKGREFSTLPLPPQPCLFQDNHEALGSQGVSPQLALRLWDSLSGRYPCKK